MYYDRVAIKSRTPELNENLLESLLVGLELRVPDYPAELLSESSQCRVCPYKDIPPLGLKREEPEPETTTEEASA